MNNRLGWILFALAFAGCGIAEGPRGQTGPTTGAEGQQWPQQDWVMPVAEANRWARRMRDILPGGWTVTVRGNSVLVARDKPVQWLEQEINGPAFSNQAEWDAYEKARVRPGPYCLEFRFGPKMSVAEYDRLNAANAAVEKERDQLRTDAEDLPHKFDSFVATTPQEAVRLAAYDQALAKLTFNELPDLYCRDFSVALSASTDGLRSVYGKEDSEECHTVKLALQALFERYEAPHGHNMYYWGHLD
jgi:hypothetical protein